MDSCGGLPKTKPLSMLVFCGGRSLIDPAVAVGSKPECDVQVERVWDSNSQTVGQCFIDLQIYIYIYADAPLSTTVPLHSQADELEFSG